MRYSIEHFIELGNRLEAFGSDGYSDGVISAAIDANSWFTREGIIAAIEAIRCEMLSREKIEQWVSHYPMLPTQSSRNVLVVMAGNIPAVGFFDMLCVLCAGHNLYIKPSHKDRALILYLREQMLEIDSTIPIFIYNEAVKIDGVIATGGESANLYFRSKYGAVPSLLRGNRSSVALFDGDESIEDIQLLTKDIYAYSGLGCRSVSMIFVPRGYSLELPCVETSKPYRNNYLQQKALAVINGEEFVDSGASILAYSTQLPAALSRISICEYSSIDEVDKWFSEHDEEIQCVASGSYKHPRVVGFGESQSPSLFDYPDAVDVMDFLTNIKA